MTPTQTQTQPKVGHVHPADWEDHDYIVTTHALVVERIRACCSREALAKVKELGLVIGGGYSLWCQVIVS